MKTLKLNHILILFLSLFSLATGFADENELVTKSTKQVRPSQVAVGKADAQAMLGRFEAEASGARSLPKDWFPSSLQDKLVPDPNIPGNFKLGQPMDPVEYIQQSMRSEKFPGYRTPDGHIALADGHHRATMVSLAEEKYGKNIEIIVEIEKDYSLAVKNGSKTMAQAQQEMMEELISQNRAYLDQDAMKIVDKAKGNYRAALDGLEPAAKARYDKMLQEGKSLEEVIQAVVREEGERLPSNVASKINAGQAQYRQAFGRIPTEVAKLGDDPMRAMVGNVFEQLGVKSAAFDNFIEFTIGDMVRDKLAERGIKMPSAVDLENDQALKTLIRDIIMEDPDIQQALKSRIRPGSHPKKGPFSEMAEASLNKAKSTYTELSSKITESLSEAEAKTFASLRSKLNLIPCAP